MGFPGGSFKIKVSGTLYAARAVKFELLQSDGDKLKTVFLVGTTLEQLENRDVTQPDVATDKQCRFRVSVNRQSAGAPCGGRSVLHAPNADGQFLHQLKYLNEISKLFSFLFLPLNS